MKSEHLRNSELQNFKSSLGPILFELLENKDQTIEEIMRNPDGSVWVDRKGSGLELIGHIQSDIEAKRTIEIVASATNRICNEKNPIVSGEIPGLGYRFTGLMPHVVQSPAWTIRLPTVSLYTLDNYAEDGIMTRAEVDKLRNIIYQGLNILVIGGTKSGKTTLVNSMLIESSKTNQRHILIEDTYELRCSAPNQVPLHSNTYATPGDLLEATMRLFPQRIIVGEAKRGKEAYTLLMAANTGHKGIMCTIHANSCKDGLYRIEEMLAETGMVPVPKAIARAMDVIIYIEATREGRKVQEIAEIKGFDTDYILQPF